MKVRYFGDNGKYFDFFRKNRGKIKINKFKIIANKIYIRYEILEGVN